ncbi:Uncharacterized protein PBTT_02672 [Plasmodiophora brassicae]|uniref:Uncharacterized protein n=1 Tax=Plasmodiophora brassicae TaxID=37360 RepID=A0A3P3Y6P8_PLABS|nr:unnamed protein product [Plasmodiophora brassicae]
MSLAAPCVVVLLAIAAVQPSATQFAPATPGTGSDSTRLPGTTLSTPVVGSRNWRAPSTDTGNSGTPSPHPLSLQDDLSSAPPAVQILHERAAEELSADDQEALAVLEARQWADQHRRDSIHSNLRGQFQNLDTTYGRLQTNAADTAQRAFDSNADHAYQLSNDNLVAARTT